ncbi:hypothetical protein HMPREF9383_2210 [Streptococcus sanguinis SK150]|jgi:hypothetical protein|uniref:DUF1310 family protein n=2 Tax=Streptococcus sanguinis TaxID=1305 RepID=F0IP68_STRSA|nr:MULTISPECIES: DUF1310 family protein [Streptococcus]MBF1689874.1 DUF1310 family protein [Streptococcus cristatus]EGD35774.1 hypothetical protein HMPREF9383_2210 [Streptococcus sanguinis SK150]MBZ2058093.1 DUF1310 domain-containing protein [Streptococcus sanguinis]MCY7034201.1 DUF1310 domain-containing protein [Streptococcus sanguinis]MDN5012038.1 DUF1310 family protein [Streptococcus sp. SN3]
MFKRRNRIMGLIGLTVLILLGVGLYLAHKNHEFQDEIFRIVHSKKVKNLIEKKLKKLDPHALTDKGKIRSYKIADRSIRHNPMGGIMFDIVINDDPDIVGSTGLRKYGENEAIQTVGMDRSKGLQKLLEE